MNPAHVTVATVVEREGRFLFVEEHVAGALVLNQPAGHWESGETLVQAAVREAREEAAWEIAPFALLGVYEHQPEDLEYGFLRFAFLAHPVRHYPEQPLDHGIARALWLDADALRALSARHRGPMVQRCVDDALRGQRFPLSLIAHLGTSTPPT